MLFAERGYRATSVRDITRAAGVTEAVLYHYFANKVELWTAVLSRYAPFGQVNAILEAVAGEPVDVALRTLGGALLNLLRGREQLLLTLLSEAPAEPEVAAVLERFLRAVGTNLAADLTARQATGEIDTDADPEAAARTFQGALLLHFLTTSLPTRRAQHSDEADAVAVDRLVTLLCSGLQPRHQSKPGCLPDSVSGS